MDRSPPDFRDRRTREFDLSEPNSEACRFDADCEAIAAVRTWWWGTRPLAAKGLLAGLILSASYLLALAVALGRRTVMGQSKTHRIPGLGSRSCTTARRRFVLVALITAVTTILWPWLVDVITYSGTRVPTPLFGGANQWTPSIIDLLSILTVILLVIRGQRKLHDKGESIRQEFGFEIERQELLTGTGSSWDTTRSRPAFSPCLVPIHALPRRSGVELAKATVSPLEAVMAQYFNYGTAIARFLRVICTAVLSSHCSSLSRPSRGFRCSPVDRCNLAGEPFRHAVPDPLDRRRALVVALVHPHSLARPAGLAGRRAAEGTQRPRPGTGARHIVAHLRLIGRRTDGVAVLVWYPSFVIATTTIALLTIQFREFQFANNPIALVVGALFVIASAIALRSAAEAFRRGTRDRLEDDRLREQKAGGGSAAQLDSLLIAWMHCATERSPPIPSSRLCARCSCPLQPTERPSYCSICRLGPDHACARTLNRRHSLRGAYPAGSDARRH